MAGLSPEAIVALLALLVALPPTTLALSRCCYRKHPSPSSTIVLSKEENGFVASHQTHLRFDSSVAIQSGLGCKLERSPTRGGDFYDIGNNP
ncbi:hypothetical protein B0H67DRAFT_135432 [Lasiosphaeris hirsuta]|uniref:Uncharacterized protein n=1 Tax=Lasiosphaeris hirsuta TaxID=260670 RepID=A0AA40E7S4_9PEZI|nr:hypothetical protein B0H67DRAFT_135432 [Lasiosphaeris hirsuta]